MTETIAVVEFMKTAALFPKKICSVVTPAAASSYYSSTNWYIITLSYQHRRRLLRTLVFYSQKLTSVRNKPNRRIPCPKPSSAVCSEVK